MGPGCVTRNFQIYRPNNLLTNPKPPLLIAYSGSVGNNPQWYADAVSRGYVVAIIFNVHDNGAPTNNLQYAFPTTAFAPPNIFKDCGVNGASYCDDIPQALYILNALNCPYVSGGSASVCQGYNTSEVFVEGGSKGGLATMAMACDTRTGPKIAGASIISNSLGSPGATASTLPNCPAMLGVGDPVSATAYQSRLIKIFPCSTFGGPMTRTTVRLTAPYQRLTTVLALVI